MIECTDKKIYKKRKYRKGKIKRFKVFFLIFIIVFSLYFFYKNAVLKQVSEISFKYAEAYSVEAVNQSTLITLADRINYSDIIILEKNQSGEIVYISADTYKVNYINKSIASNCEKLLKDKLSKGVPIPILAFSGLSFLSGYGRTVNFKSISVSSVSSDFTSEFVSVGINQTKHSIWVSVKCKVAIFAPLYMKEHEFSSNVLVCESVLVGKVPEIYLNGKIFS